MLPTRFAARHYCTFISQNLSQNYTREVEIGRNIFILYTVKRKSEIKKSQKLTLCKCLMCHQDQKGHAQNQLPPHAFRSFNGTRIPGVIPTRMQSVPFHLSRNNCSRKRDALRAFKPCARCFLKSFVLSRKLHKDGRGRIIVMQINIFV